MTPVTRHNKLGKLLFDFAHFKTRLFTSSGWVSSESESASCLSWPVKDKGLVNVHRIPATNNASYSRNGFTALLTTLPKTSCHPRNCGVDYLGTALLYESQHPSRLLHVTRIILIQTSSPSALLAWLLYPSSPLDLRHCSPSQENRSNHRQRASYPHPIDSEPL